MLAVNQVKEAASSGRAIRGVHLTFAAPAVIEVLSSLDLQFFYIDAEHGCFDWRDIEIACITAERCGVTAIARVPDIATATITRFLDRGVRGIVAPHIESIDDARKVIDAACFAPLGQRSFASVRPGYRQRMGDRTSYMQASNAALSIGLMIENASGLAQAGELASLPGVDYLSFGLADLAQSLGHPGVPDHPAVKGAVADATQRIRGCGKRVREDFMNYVWINDVLMEGGRRLLGLGEGSNPES